jgi:Glycosyl hydrolases family 31
MNLSPGSFSSADRESKHYHAVYFESIDSPAEIQILKSNVIVIRQFHSSSFQLKLFTGPEYADVYRQIIKQLPHYVPKGFWPHGVHLCHSSEIYNETETRMELEHLLSDENVKSIPFDSHCIQDELTALIISRNETESALNDYEEIIEKMRKHSKKLLFHISLSMMEESANDSYQQALDGELFLQDDDGTNFAGIYGKTKKVFYFDYITKSKKIADLLASRWLNLTNFLNLTSGVFLHKSYPHDDTANKSMKYLESFKFKPKNIGGLVRNLIPLDLKLNNGELLIHQLNNYGRKQIELFQTFNRNAKFCITDSYREDSSCALLIKDSKPSWISFQAIVHKSVFYSLIGMSFYGAEVCGSNHGAVQEDLCIRWYQFAIFSPLLYIKSDKGASKFTKYAKRIMGHAIRTRYSLLNYMRMYLMERIPLLKPLRLTYTEMDEKTELSTNHQFMFGESLMIAPVTQAVVVELELLFPEKYFEFWSGLEMPQNTTHFSVVMQDIPIFIRAGHIVATNLVYESLSAEEARLQPYILIVALSCTERFTCHSRGELVVEKDLLKFSFSASETQLNITAVTQNPSESRHALCDPERFASGEFLLAKIYGLGEFKEKYRNDYLSLDLNICDDADWKETFSFSI